MGSTGEPDRKRRHFSSISPTAAAAASKKQPFWPSSEDKKLDTTVLQFQNKKLTGKLEEKKVEYSILENKFSQVKEKQRPYKSTLEVVNKSWEELVTNLESCSIRMRESSGTQGAKNILTKEEDPFLSRLIETGATESSSSESCHNQMEENRETASEKIQNILRNLVAVIDDLWHLRDGLYDAVLKELPEDGSCWQKASSELEAETKGLRLALNDLHLKHKSLSRELQSHQDIDARNKTELKRLKGELEIAVAELEESNSKVDTLKAEKDATKGAFFPVLNLGSKHVAGDKVKDRLRDLQDMELALKELVDQASCRLLELKGLHEERIKILERISNMQNSLKNVKHISSSQAFLLVREQLQKSKSEVFQYQALFEKLQVEKDNFPWRERELNLETDLVDVSRRSFAIADFRIADLENEIQKQIEERKRIEKKLEEASKETGRKEIIAEFKLLVSSFPEEMSNMQSQLRKCKEAAVDIHSLQGDVQYLSRVHDRKRKECETLSARSTNQASKIHELQALVQDLKDRDMELKLILDMYRRESTNSRDVVEAKELEYKAWAHVQSLKSSLDEQILELRVKTANEAEAVSQQRLAATEAEIADMRQKLEASKREIATLSDVLKSKNEENETYLSEIETIGQAYDDMQTQNQQLLQQTTERDDYNIKLIVEGARARQQWDALWTDKRKMEKEIQQTNASLDFYAMKASRIEEQLRCCLDQVEKLAEDRLQKSVTLETMLKRLSDVRRASDQARESLEGSQSKVNRSRLAYLELETELEIERFNKKRKEEELDIVKRKTLRLRAQTEGSSVVEKLRQELREYREILKCSICLDRPKEVVITKCYHLFCNPCVQKITENRHRKCPMCSASFGPNDVKPVYI